MTRTTAREIAVSLGFRLCENDFPDAAAALDTFFDRDYYSTLSGEGEAFAEYPDKRQLEYIKSLALGVYEKRSELEEYIQMYSKKWRIDRISKTALAIMRSAMYEIKYMEVPPSAAINEAVELAKGFEEKETVSFINGILGSFVRGENSVEESEETSGLSETAQVADVAEDASEEGEAEAVVEAASEEE